MNADYYIFSTSTLSASASKRTKSVLENDINKCISQGLTAVLDKSISRGSLTLQTNGDFEFNAGSESVPFQVNSFSYKARSGSFESAVSSTAYLVRISPSVSPQPAYRTTSALVCDEGVDMGDLEGSYLRFAYKWFKDGSEVSGQRSRTLPDSFFLWSVGAKIKCQVEVLKVSSNPNNGTIYATGEPFLSSETVIQYADLDPTFLTGTLRDFSSAFGDMEFPSSSQFKLPIDQHILHYYPQKHCH